MSKSINFVVTLTFEDDIETEANVREIAHNVKRAIFNEAKSGIGIVPEDSDSYTSSIQVSHNGIIQSVIHF